MRKRECPGPGLLKYIFHPLSKHPTFTPTCLTPPIFRLIFVLLSSKLGYLFHLIFTRCETSSGHKHTTHSPFSPILTVVPSWNLSLHHWWDWFWCFLSFGFLAPSGTACEGGLFCYEGVQARSVSTFFLCLWASEIFIAVELLWQCEQWGLSALSGLLGWRHSKGEEEQGWGISVW